MCVSNDGVTFENPKDVKEPLLTIIKRANSKLAKYYGDNFLLFEDGKLQVWYRYTDEDKNFVPARLGNKI